jgi:hypothetical protein
MLRAVVTLLVGIGAFSGHLLADGLDGKGLGPAADAALSGVAELPDKVEVFAWRSEITKTGDTEGAIEVVVLSKDDLRMTYSCTDQEGELGCTSGGSTEGQTEYPNAASLDLKFLKMMQARAIFKAESALPREFGVEFAQAVTSITVWTYKDKGHGHDHDHSHEHGPDVWVRFDFLDGDQERALYIQAHVHKNGSLGLHKKPASDVEGEPSFDFDIAEAEQNGSNEK